MPRYIIEREVGTGNAKQMQEQLDAVGRQSLDIAAGIPGLRWIRSYISEVEGKVYCEYEAPNPEAILEHARIGGWPANKISEISMDVSPDMFR